MRVMFATHPADGHLNPMLGLSAALRDAGHEVVFVSAPRFVHRIVARGENAIACGTDWLEEEGAPDEPTAADLEVPGQKMFSRLFLRRTATDVAGQLADIFEAWQPDLLVRESVEFGSAAAAEAAGIPWCTFEILFPHELEDEIAADDIAGPERAAIRAAAGLPDNGDPHWFLGQLRIACLPPSYTGQPGHTDIPTVLIRPHTLDLVDDAPVPPWLENVDDLVYVTLGTVFPQHAPHLLTAGATGAADAGHHVVLTTGRIVAPASLGLPTDLPIHAEHYVPQGPVLDRAACAVVHGGSGSTVGALARGVPLVVIPLGADQHGHAAAVERTGCGVSIDAATADRRAVADAVRRVTGDPRFRRNARTIGNELLALPGPEAAIEALASLVG